MTRSEREEGGGGSERNRERERERGIYFPTNFTELIEDRMKNDSPVLVQSQGFKTAAEEDISVNLIQMCKIRNF